ncbi:MAG: hypothetical protein K0R31_1042 [Clostridiales bacterium]|jgi:hypothetical protein|nr:hypothetical protein [Clostridiales bacterium]
MFGFLKRPSTEKKFDKSVLRKNDISILILDERWNSLFGASQKTPEIVQCEENLKELLKEQARLTAESKEISQRKKASMDRIILLTTEAFEKENEEAKIEMQQCQTEILKIIDRSNQILEELENIPDRIKQANLDLLELMVNVVYFKIRSSQKRIGELEQLIEETREKLKEYIDEKEVLAQDGADTYTYFHDLLGGDELEKLDKQYFG